MEDWWGRLLNVKKLFAIEKREEGGGDGFGGPPEGANWGGVHRKKKHRTASIPTLPKKLSVGLGECVRKPPRRGRISTTLWGGGLKRKGGKFAIRLRISVEATGGKGKS